MGLWGRFLIYKLDCLVMLGIIGVQFALYRGDQVFDVYPGDWLAQLFVHVGNLWVITLIGSTLYWLVVDYHPALERLRQSKVVTLEGNHRPDFGTRFVRSFVKAVSLFTFQGLLLVGLFSDDHQFAHDKVTGTRRVAVAEA